MRVGKWGLKFKNMTHMPKNVRIRHMWKMYKLMRLFVNYPYRTGAGSKEWYDFQHQGIDQEKFKQFLLYQKKFLYSWKARFEDLTRLWFGWNTDTTPEGLEREYRRMHDIELAIAGCLKKGYIECIFFPNIRLTEKGSRLGNSLGFVIGNELLSEYSDAKIFIGSILGSLLLAKVVKIAWDWLVHIRM